MLALRLLADHDSKFDSIPGAPDCWVDGFDDGVEDKYNQDRGDECRTDDDDNPYYKGWLAGCVDAGNTREDCKMLVDASGDLQDLLLRHGDDDDGSYSEPN